MTWCRTFLRNCVVMVPWLSPVHIFFGLTPPPYTQFRDPGVRPAPQGGPMGLQGKEVVFFEMEWPGFKPRTSSIRRGCSIHSTTPHLEA